MGKKHKTPKTTFAEIMRGLSRNEEVPVFNFPANEEQQVPEPQEPSVNGEFFKWKFSKNFCDLSNRNYGWHKATPESLFFGALDSLQYYETLTWNQVMKLKSAHYHGVPYDKLTDNTRRKIESFIHGENGDLLCQLAAHGEHRMIGVKQGATFYLVWNDEKHQVYRE